MVIKRLYTRKPQCPTEYAPCVPCRAREQLYISHVHLTAMTCHIQVPSL